MANIRETKRASRIMAVRNWIQTAKVSEANIDPQKLIATICMEFGVSRRTAMEYVSVLVDSGSIEL